MLNDRLSRFLTPSQDKVTIVQRSQINSCRAPMPGLGSFGALYSLHTATKLPLYLFIS
jgi:hypothetical protein